MVSLLCQHPACHSSNPTSSDLDIASGPFNSLITSHYVYYPVQFPILCAPPPRQPNTNQICFQGQTGSPVPHPTNPTIILYPPLLPSYCYYGFSSCVRGPGPCYIEASGLCVAASGRTGGAYVHMHPYCKRVRIVTLNT